MPKPPEQATTPGEEPKEQADPRAELVRQLLEYKKYRDAAEALENRADSWRRRFPAAPALAHAEALKAAIDNAADIELEDLDLLDLVDAFSRIAETVNFERLGDHQVKYDDTPIELHAEDILNRLRADGPGGEDAPKEMELASMFQGRSRSEMVGLFLALLELVRSRKVAVRQDRIEGQIMLRLRDEEPSAPEVAT